MKLEDQVTSLGLSQMLKTLGVKQESLFSWCRSTTKPESIPFVSFEQNEGTFIGEFICSAFTISELSEIIPQRYGTFKVNDYFHAFELDEGGNFIRPLLIKPITAFGVLTEAEMRGHLLWWAINHRPSEIKL